MHSKVFCTKIVFVLLSYCPSSARKHNVNIVLRQKVNLSLSIFQSIHPDLKYLYICSITEYSKPCCSLRSVLTVSISKPGWGKSNWREWMTEPHPLLSTITIKVLLSKALNPDLLQWSCWIICCCDRRLPRVVVWKNMNTLNTVCIRISPSHMEGKVLVWHTHPNTHTLCLTYIITHTRWYNDAVVSTLFRWNDLFIIMIA